MGQLPDPLVPDPQNQRNFDALRVSVNSLSGGVKAISASDATYSGTVRITGGPNITVGTDASGISISGATAGGGGSGILGISASNAVYTSGTVAFTGSNQVTVRSTTGQAVVIDVTTASQTVQTQSMVNAISNSQASFSGTVNLSGAGAVAVGSQTGNAFTISAPVQTAQTGISSIAASDATYTSGQVQFTGSQAVTVKSSAGQRVVIDAPAQTVQSQSLVRAISASNSTFDGTVRVTGGNNITVGTDASGVTISGPNTAAQSVQPGVQHLVASNNTFSSGTVSVTGEGGGVTVNTAASKIQVSVAAPVAQSAETGQLRSVSISNNASTSGTLANISSGALSLIAGPNITLSQNANTVAISAGAPGAGGGVAHIVASDNTFSSGTVSVTGAGEGITVNTAASKIQISGAQTGVKHLVASDNTFSSGTVSITGTGGGVTVNTAASKIQVSVAAPVAQTSPTLNVFRNMEMGPAATPLSVIDIAAAQRSVLVQPLVDGNIDAFPGNMTVNTWLMPISISGSTATMSAAHTSIFRLGIYTNNAGTLSMINSASTSFGSGAANANLSTQFAGVRWLSLGTAQWSSSPVFSQAQYWWAFHYSTAGVSNQSLSLFGQNLHASNSTSAGTVGVASVANATRMGAAPFYGAYSATTAALPATIGSADLNKQVALGVFVPSMLLNNISSQF